VATAVSKPEIKNPAIARRVLSVLRKASRPDAMRGGR
jgi:hypothetical protein